MKVLHYSRLYITGVCPEVNCDDELSPLARAQPKDIYSETPDEGVIMASTTVFVLEPGEEPCKYNLYHSEVRNLSLDVSIGFQLGNNLNYH